MSDLLDSQVVSSTVTGVLAIVGTVVVYALSKRKPKRYFKKNAAVNPQNYAGYENLIKEINANNTEQHRLKDAEIHRLYERDQARDQLIDVLRAKETELYKIIEAKNQEISQLRHLRQYTDAAKSIPRSSMHNNTAEDSAKHE